MVSSGRPGSEAGESTISAMFREAVDTHWIWPRNRRVSSRVTISPLPQPCPCPIPWSSPPTLSSKGPRGSPSHLPQLRRDFFHQQQSRRILAHQVPDGYWLPLQVTSGQYLGQENADALGPIGPAYAATLPRLFRRNESEAQASKTTHGEATPAPSLS